MRPSTPARHTQSLGRRTYPLRVSGRHIYPLQAALHTHRPGCGTGQLQTLGRLTYPLQVSGRLIYRLLAVLRTHRPGRDTGPAFMVVRSRPGADARLLTIMHQPRFTTNHPSTASSSWERKEAFKWL